MKFTGFNRGLAFFLKFIGSVVPTIEYDYTMASATAGTGKS